MNSRQTELLTGYFTRSVVAMFAIAATLSLSACARKPWREPLADDDRRTVLQVIDEIRERDAGRSDCIDSDVNIFFTSHLKNRAVSGYVQLMQPNSVKFVSSNPFGQPLFAFVNTGSFFQFVNTLEQYVMDGDLNEFARMHDVPLFAVTSSWGQWLTARMPEADDIVDIRQDSSDRGIWVSISSRMSNTAGNESQKQRTEHLLIDRENKMLLGRIFTDAYDRTEAEINYSDWLSDASEEERRQPGMIRISGLDYGGEIILKFSALQTMEGCTINDFYLQRPMGYQYLPLPLSY
jgi:hypothetical protein